MSERKWSAFVDILLLATETAFVTVTLSVADHHNPSPGNFDPQIPDVLAIYTAHQAAISSSPERRSLLEERANRWRLRRDQMSPQSWDRRIDWWHDPYEATDQQQSLTASAGAPRLILSSGPRANVSDANIV